MNYFRYDGRLKLGEQTTIRNDVARHIRDSRRMKVGEEVSIQDFTPQRFLARITEVDRNTITVEPFKEIELPQEPAHRVTLLQALIAEQNIDMILQKTTELGVATIILFQADRSPNTVKEDRLDHKLTRWNNILNAACEQSGRTNPPFLAIEKSLAHALTHAHGSVLLLDYEGSALKSSDEEATIIVGPEGGFTSEEKETILAHPQSTSVSIGTYTLRAETAAIAGVARLI
ncbi:MAG: rsmE [Candidatus Kaiserbacteria bacterium]|nr:rsmE [Candidatus Kaiserbacteria bacterium]